MKKKLLAGLCAAAMLLALLPAAVALDAGTQLYHRLAPGTAAEAKQLWPTNTTVVMNPCTFEEESWRQAAYYNAKTSGGGLPDGESLYIDIPDVSIPAGTYADVALSLRYGACPHSGDPVVGKNGQFRIYASTDGGATWSEEHAGLYAQTVNGLGRTQNDLDVWVYTAVSTDLTALVSDEATINALRIVPFEGDTARTGVVRIQEITVTGYAQERPAPDGSVPGPVLEETFDYLPVGGGLPLKVLFDRHVINGGVVDALVRRDDSDQYLELSVANTADSTKTSRSRVSTARASSGTFTVQWDYRRESPVRFDSFLRSNAEVYVMVADTGKVYLYVLDSAKVPGVMETKYCGFQAVTGTWYTFKASVSDTVVNLDVYDRESGTRVGGATLPQDTTNAPNMLNPACQSFGIWSYSTLSNVETATAGLDNLYVTSGWYEGLHAPKEFEEHVFDRVTFEGSGGTLTVDNFVMNTQEELHPAMETFDDGELPAGWSGQGTLADGDELGTLRAALRGKKVSFLGDSISTYNGWSNNPEFNPTLSKNSVFYPNVSTTGGWMTDPEQTWWLRTTRLSGMDLLVDNAYSGDKLNRAKSGKGLDRCVQLHHADGRTPDVIVVLFGTNDAISTSSSVVTQFETDYEEMITSIRATYPKAELFLCELLPRTGMSKYPCNKKIRALAEKYGVRLVETASCGHQDMQANYLDGLHPTPAGMKLISAKVVEALGDWAGPALRGKSLTLTDGAAEYRTQEGITADLIFDCKISGEGAYTVRLGTEGRDLVQVELPVEDMEKDTWYTVRVRTDGTGAEIVTEVMKAPAVATVEKLPDVPGDLNGDREVDAKDVVQLMRFAAGGYGVELDETAADLNHDGKVNAKDILLLIRFVAGGYGVEL